jgi:hypothetical protein
LVDEPAFGRTWRRQPAARGDRSLVAGRIVRDGWPVFLHAYADIERATQVKRRKLLFRSASIPSRAGFQPAPISIVPYRRFSTILAFVG